MNIHLLGTDIWFYTTLLCLAGYGVLALIAYRFLKPVLKVFRAKSKFVKITNLTPAPTSSLRAKLYASNDRP